MNETEANLLLKELASRHGSEKLNAQDYRRQRRLILAKFSASDCATMDETIEWHEPKRREDDTAELKSPLDGEDTAEFKIISRTRIYKIMGFAAAALLVGLYFAWRRL